MGLFGITKNCDSQSATMISHVQIQLKKERRYSGEKKVGRAMVNKESIGGIETSKYNGFSLAD